MSGEYSCELYILAFSYYLYIWVIHYYNTTLDTLLLDTLLDNTT